MSEGGSPSTDLAASLARPDADHSPAAYWFWHHLPDEAQIREQVGQMQDGGYQSFQIQARIAYPIEQYLDDDYLRACRIAVDEAARRGMTVGIYDDYNWQSGQAGGRTVHGHDEVRERHLFWASGPADGTSMSLTVDQIHSSAADLGEAGLSWQYDDSRVTWTEWDIVAAVAYPAAGICSLTEVHDVTKHAAIASATERACAVDVTLPDELAGAQVTVFVAARSATSRVPNYLMPEAAQRFIEAGYEPFRRTFGEYFGSTVTYVFFDQPHASFHDWPQRHGNLRSSMLYTAALAEAFTARTGRSFAHGLTAVLLDVGPETASVRCDFYQCFTDQVFAAFLAPLRAWCEENGIALSGHEVLGHVGSWHPTRAFSTWDLRVNFGLDSFGLDSYRGITGVDAQDCVPQLSAKMGDSVARANGRSGCIVEQYMGKGSGSGTSWAGHWGLTLEELRAQAIRLHLTGARQFLFHGFYQTDGWDDDFRLFFNPRFDFPPGINFEPWWPFHRAFADESGRLSTFIDAARPACDVAILYPLRTCWAEGPGHNYGDHMAFWASALTEAGFGYHFIDERNLLAASTAGGELRIGDRSYPALVLPSITTVSSPATLSAMAAFADAGGLLISSGDAPSWLQQGNEAAARDGWAAVQAAPSARHIRGVPDAGAVLPVLAPLLARHPHATAAAHRPDGAHLWQWAGTDADGSWRLVLFNDSDEPASVEITGPGSASEWQQVDVAEGTVTEWWSGCGHALQHSLKPMELTAFRMRYTDAPARPAEPEAAPASSAQPELVPLSAGWTLTIPGADEAVAVDVTRGWEEQGFAAYSGLGTYACQFDRPSAGQWQLRVPAVRTAVEVRLNGEGIGRRAWAPFTFDLPARLLRPAGNRLEIAVYSAAGNRYYAGSPFQDHPEQCGLTGAPVLARS